MWPLVMYSKIVSTVTFLDSQIRLICGMFLFNTVILCHYTINKD